MCAMAAQRCASGAAESGSEARADAGSRRLDALVRCVGWQGHGAHSPAPRVPPPLSLQLLLQLVEEAPVGALGQELLRARLEHPNLMQAQSIEPHRILGVVLTPFIVGELLHSLEGQA